MGGHRAWRPSLLADYIPLHMMPWHSIKQGLKCLLDRPRAYAEERKVGRTRSHFRSLSCAHSSLEKDKLDDMQMPICLFNHNASDFGP